MNRTVMMTLGFLLVFFGIQLNVIDSFVLTPRMTTFLSDQFSEEDGGLVRAVPMGDPNQPTPYAQVGYVPTPGLAMPAALEENRVIRPPSWIGWPIMFLGAVFFLNGVAVKR